MIHRILTAAALAVALAAPALAADDAIDRLLDRCENTPIAKMTRGQLETCGKVDKLLDDIARIRSERTTGSSVTMPVGQPR